MFDHIEKPIVDESRHLYHFLAAQRDMLRYCETCGKAWILDMSYGPHWRPIEEPGRENTPEQKKDILALARNALNYIDMYGEDVSLFHIEEALKDIVALCADNDE